MIRTIRRILDLLTSREKRTGLLVLAMVVVMAFIETAAVASVMPFLAVLGNPAIVQSNRHLAWAYELGGFEDTQSFLTVLGVVCFGLVVFGALFKLATLQAVHRWANMRRHSVSVRLMTKYLNQPYEFFLNRNASQLSTSVLSEAEELTTKVFRPGLLFLSHAIMAVLLVVFLFVVDPQVALLVTGVVAGCYALTYLGVRGLLNRLGRDRADANQQRFILAGEALTAIKEIKVLGREAEYLSRFEYPSHRFSRFHALSAVIALMPKYLIEAIGIGGILALAVYFTMVGQELGTTLPVLGLYAFAGYRLLPAAQQVFATLSDLRFGSAAVDCVHRDLVELEEPCESEPLTAVVDPLPEPPMFQHSVCLEDVEFTFDRSVGPVLQDVSVTIPKNTSLGIVGATGAGKSTLVDLLLGLLAPTGGSILLDGVAVSEIGVRRWQRALGYVPQDIFISDASVTANIAFGVPHAELDMTRVRRAAQVAQIAGFIEGLPDGYRTVLGDRGIRISGGERQRVGIARALYRDPEVLILDEATSALDLRTEAEVMSAVDGLQGEKTIVMIAHRLSTVRNCDQVIVMERGRIAGVGKYEDLAHSNPAFQKVSSG